MALQVAEDRKGTKVRVGSHPTVGVIDSLAYLPGNNGVANAAIIYWPEANTYTPWRLTALNLVD